MSLPPPPIPHPHFPECTSLQLFKMNIYRDVTSRACSVAESESRTGQGLADASGSLFGDLEVRRTVPESSRERWSRRKREDEEVLRGRGAGGRGGANGRRSREEEEEEEEQQRGRAGRGGAKRKSRRRRRRSRRSRRCWQNEELSIPAQAGVSSTF